MGQNKHSGALICFVQEGEQSVNLSVAFMSLNLSGSSHGFFKGGVRAVIRCGGGQCGRAVPQARRATTRLPILQTEGVFSAVGDV